MASATARARYSGASYIAARVAQPGDVTPRTNPVSGQSDGYDFEGPTRFDKLFTGIAVKRPAELVPGDINGFENTSPEDTFDADYGRLLERAYGKGVASPTGVRDTYEPGRGETYELPLCGTVRKAA